MLQIGSIDAGHCIDAPNTSARKTRVTPIARHTYRKTGVTHTVHWKECWQAALHLLRRTFVVIHH